MMLACDQTGVPIHFNSSTTSGSASLMSLRILARVFPRQSPSSAILCEMSSDAGRLFPLDFFMFDPGGSGAMRNQMAGHSLPNPNGASHLLAALLGSRFGGRAQ